MGLKVVMPGMLGTALGDESRLIFGEYSFFISLLCEHPFVGNRDGADWFIDEHPSPHAPELLKRSSSAWIASSHSGQSGDSRASFRLWQSSPGITVKASSLAFEIMPASSSSGKGSLM